MKIRILSAIVVASCLASTGQAAGLFSDDEGTHVTNHRQPQHFAYRNGTAPIDYPATAYDRNMNSTIQGVGHHGYYGHRGGGCENCGNVWDGYQPCSHGGCGHKGFGCKKGCGLKGHGCRAPKCCKSRCCGGCNPCGCNVYGYRAHACCGCKKACGCKKICGLKKACGFGGGGDDACGQPCGCHKRCGFKRACGLKKCGHGFKSLCCGVGQCFGGQGNYFGFDDGVTSEPTEIQPQSDSETLPPGQDINSRPTDAPVPPSDVRADANRGWQNRSTAFVPQMQYPRNR